MRRKDALKKCVECGRVKDEHYPFSGKLWCSTINADTRQFTPASVPAQEETKP